MKEKRAKITVRPKPANIELVSTFEVMNVDLPIGQSIEKVIDLCFLTKRRGDPSVHVGPRLRLDRTKAASLVLALQQGVAIAEGHPPPAIGVSH